MPNLNKLCYSLTYKEHLVHSSMGVSLSTIVLNSRDQPKNSGILNLQFICKMRVRHMCTFESENLTIKESMI